VWSLGLPIHFNLSRENLECGLFRNKRVASPPPINPPVWAFQSIPGIRKGIARFIAINVAASLKFAPIRLPVIANAPNRPKIMPEAPTAKVCGGLNKYEASEPTIREESRIKIYLFLP